MTEMNYKQVCEKYGGKTIKLGGEVTKEIRDPLFSIGDTVETIEDYEAVDCPAEKGVVTGIIDGGGDYLYEIDNKTVVYEKWLRKVI